MNGLVTDFQMFALKTLHIPLPGRHPPSDGSTTTGHSSSDRSTPEQAHHEQSDSIHSMGTESPQLKISPAMTTLQGFYRLKGASNISEDGGFPRNLILSNRPLSHHRKSRSLVNVILSKIEEKPEIVPADKAREGDSDKWNDKRVRRRQKSEGNFPPPELLLREDNSSSSSSGFSSRTGKGLALRQKAASRTSLTIDSEGSGLNPVPIGLEDVSLTDVQFGVKKSSSTSCLQDEGNCSSSSVWPTSRWNLKPDLQAFSSAKPIFDGLPKPITGRRNKAALD
ncbi:LysM and putative peptidoglycan-binding domain-containing protein 1 [Senna tora]|uniref:LysM and putative peptidoglycan-binding domain-containing protein 1 n=1 Tax=Senna tora TaxID=362788 RepID=A0A834SRK8_9FABA|nr:LysM and putative peptidoglycan-binding domain-containing protein 1 [Senna tora]